MNSNKNRAELADALDSLDEAEAALLRAPLHTLNRAELAQLISRLDGLEQRVRAHRQRLRGKLISQSHHTRGAAS